MAKEEKVTIRLDDIHISKVDAAKEAMKRAFMTKISGFVIIVGLLIVYGCFLVNPAVAFVCVAVFLCGGVFFVFKAEQDLNYLSSTYNLEKPVLLKGGSNSRR